MKFGDFRRNFGQCPMALFDEEAGSVGEWSTVTFRKGATAGDVRAAAQQLFAIPAEHATVAKGAHVRLKSEEIWPNFRMIWHIFAYLGQGLLYILGGFKYECFGQ